MKQQVTRQLAIAHHPVNPRTPSSHTQGALSKSSIMSNVGGQNFNIVNKSQVPEDQIRLQHLNKRVNNRPRTSQNTQISHNKQFNQQPVTSQQDRRTANNMSSQNQNFKYLSNIVSKANSPLQVVQQPLPIGFKTQKVSERGQMIDYTKAYEAFLQGQSSNKFCLHERRESGLNIDQHLQKMQNSTSIMPFSPNSGLAQNINQNGRKEKINLQQIQKNEEQQKSRNSSVIKTDGDLSQNKVFSGATNGSRTSQIKSRLDKLNRQRQYSSAEIPDVTTNDDKNMFVISDKSPNNLYAQQTNPTMNLISNISRGSLNASKPSNQKRRSKARYGSVLGDNSEQFLSSVLASSPNCQQHGGINISQEMINVPEFNQNRDRSQRKIINFHKIYQSQKNFFADDVHIVKQQLQNQKSGKKRRNIQITKKSQDIKMLQEEVQLLRQRQSLKEMKFDHLTHQINTFMKNQELIKSLTSKMHQAQAHPPQSIPIDERKIVHDKEKIVKSPQISQRDLIGKMS